VYVRVCACAYVRIHSILVNVTIIVNIIDIIITIITIITA
jgi:hypothetical protein